MHRLFCFVFCAYKICNVNITLNFNKRQQLKKQYLFGYRRCHKQLTDCFFFSFFGGIKLIDRFIFYVCLIRLSSKDWQVAISDFVRILISNIFHIFQFQKLEMLKVTDLRFRQSPYSFVKGVNIITRKPIVTSDTVHNIVIPHEVMIIC